MNADTDLPPESLIAFAGNQIIAEGPRRDVTKKLTLYLRNHPESNILIFDDRTSAQVELDLRGYSDEVQSQIVDVGQEPYKIPDKPGPGRPKLGVVSREVGLLPRQWAWLSEQPGGASVTLRKLVDEAKRANRSKDEKRQAQDAAYRFMTAMAGDFAHYEEALRAFFAGNKELFETLCRSWPKDVRIQAFKLANRAFS